MGVSIKNWFLLVLAQVPRWPGLTDCAADCSAPCGPIWLKFYVVNGLGYGYKQCKFRWGMSRYAGAAVEKLSKTDGFCRFWPRLTDGTADCSGPCGPMWLKFFFVGKLGYGHNWFQFRWDASRNVSAAFEKLSKTNDFHASTSAGKWNLTQNVPACSILPWPATNECYTTKKFYHSRRSARRTVLEYINLGQS